MINVIFKKTADSFFPGTEATFYLKNFTQAQLNWEMNRQEERSGDKRVKSNRK